MIISITVHDTSMKDRTDEIHSLGTPPAKSSMSFDPDKGQVFTWMFRDKKLADELKAKLASIPDIVVEN